VVHRYDEGSSPGEVLGHAVAVVTIDLQIEIAGAAATPGEAIERALRPGPATGGPAHPSSDDLARTERQGVRNINLNYVLDDVLDRRDGI
jgi:hypothetical protein